MIENKNTFSFQIGNLKTFLSAAAEVAIVLTILDRLERKNTYYYPTQPKKQKYFPESTKKDTKLQQRYLCNKCKQTPEFWEFHHRDGDSSNNSPSNCELLRPNCHAKKTRK